MRLANFFRVALEFTPHDPLPCHPPAMETRWDGVEELDLRLHLDKRDACLHALGEHHAAGRMSVEELDRRVQAALAAETEEELAALVVDLRQEPAERSTPPQSRRLLARPVARWATAYATLTSTGLLLAVVGPRTNAAEFSAGATAAMVGFVTHWVVTRGSADTSGPPSS